MILKVLGDKDRTRVGFVDFATMRKVKVVPKQYQHCGKERVEWGNVSVLSGFSEALTPRACKEGSRMVAFSGRATFCFAQLSFVVIIEEAPDPRHE